MRFRSQFAFRYAQMGLNSAQVDRISRRTGDFGPIGAETGLICAEIERI